MNNDDEDFPNAPPGLLYIPILPFKIADEASTDVCDGVDGEESVD